MPPLKLVIGNQNYSSWSLRAWLLLKQSGIEFEEIKLMLHQNDNSLLDQYSPSGKVPVLMDGDTKIWESLAIGEYLAERYPEKQLWPKDTLARALARSISSEMHAGFMNLRKNMPMNCKAKLPGKGMGPGVQEDINRIQSIWSECRNVYGAAGKFLFGRFMVPDAMFAPVVVRFSVYDVKLDSAAREYRDTILSLPAMQEWIGEARAEKELIPELEVQK